MPLDIDPLYVFYVFAALAAVLAVEALYLLFHNSKDYRTRVNRRLQVSAKEADREKVLVQLRRERGLTAEGGYALPLVWLNRLLLQSGAKVAPSRGALILSLCGAIGFAGVFTVRGDLLEAAGAGAVAMTLLPLLALAMLRKRRRATFGLQLPEAIDVIVRSLRAGHPVPVAVSMVARELPDPVGSEFGMVNDEITYGSELEAAMRAMTARVGQEDLPLLVTSIAIQSSTGGNLSQILENLSKVIRDRSKMRRKVRGLSSEGRASAMILNAVPFVVFTLINLISPDFYGSLWNEPATKMVLGAGVGWMLVGNLIMRRMINFKI